MNQVIIGGKRVRVNPSDSVGKGGEADIYRIDGGLVLKLFKQPDHPDYDGLPGEQHAAAERIRAHQNKLRAFPKGMPQRVVAPVDLATDTAGRVVGYTMPFVDRADVILRLAQPSYRKAGITDTSVVDTFKDLHGTVGQVHNLAVIGDFNDLNVLVRGTEAWVIDADSFQFGQYMCMLFTQRFVDPTLCDRHAKSPMLVRPHNPMSDWYAFTTLLFQSLMLVDPYGGVYQPKSPSNRLTPPERPLHRVTVFHPEVRFPSKARHWKVLPDELVGYFEKVYLKDHRAEFPHQLIEGMHWVSCTNCGTSHSRRTCPECAVAVAQPVKVTRKGLTVTQVFTTGGLIRYAGMQSGKLHFVVHDNNTVTHSTAQVSTRASGRRESTVIQLSTVGLPMIPQTRFRVKQDSMLIGLQGRLITVTPNVQPSAIGVESYQNMPVFDANESHHYWLANGQLKRDALFGEEVIGEVLAGQTLFWVGPRFGFGFYRAGNISVSFLFDAERRGINDEVLRGKLPPMRGQLIDTTCVFTSTRCWFFQSVQEGARKVNKVAVFTSAGVVEATAETDEGDGSWLGSIHGKCATGTTLFAPTDEGVVRLSVENGQIVQKEIFQGTEQFVKEGCYLHLTPQGALYVVTDREILELTIS